MKKYKFHQSIKFALNGIAHGISMERNIKIQGFIGILILLLSIYLQIPRIEIVIILFVIFFVIIMELINTAIEKLIDKIHPDRNDEIGKVKDIMAGAVLLSVILSIIIGFVILLKPIILLLGL